MKGREGQGIEIRFAEMFSPVTITKRKGGRGEEMLEKCREILVNAYLAPGFLPSRLRRSLMKQFDEEESWTQ